MRNRETVKRSAVILVGGEASRAGGREKYFFPIQGTTFLDRLIETLTPMMDEVVLVARDTEQCERFSSFPTARVTVDRRRGLGPIGGLHAGALTATGDALFVVACDMPLVNSDVVEYLFSLLDERDAVIPCWREEMLEPLHAVYRRAPLCQYLKNHQELSLRAMIRSLDCRYISVDSLRRFDPELRTFTNINRVDELALLDEEAGAHP